MRFLILALLLGCTPPANVTADFTAMVACIVANYADWPVLLAKCSGYTLAELEAAIQWLLADPAFAKAHPEAIEPLKARLVNVRAQMEKKLEKKLEKKP